MGTLVTLSSHSHTLVMLFRLVPAWCAAHLLLCLLLVLGTLVSGSLAVLSL